MTKLLLKEVAKEATEKIDISLNYLIKVRGDKISNTVKEEVARHAKEAKDSIANALKEEAKRSKKHAYNTSVNANGTFRIDLDEPIVIAGETDPLTDLSTIIEKAVNGVVNAVETHTTQEVYAVAEGQTYDLSALNARKLQLEQLIQRLQARPAAIAAAIAALQMQKTQLEGDRQRLTQDRQDLQDEIQQLTQNKAQILQEIAGQQQILHNIKDDIINKQKKLSEINIDIADKQQELLDKQRELDNLKAEIASEGARLAAQASAAQSAAVEALKQQTTQANDLRREIAGLEAEILDAKSRKAEAEAAHEAGENEELARLKAETTASEATIEEQRKQLAANAKEIATLKDTVAKWKEKHEAITAELATSKVKIAELTNELKDANARIGELTESLTDLNVKGEEISQLQTKADEVAGLRSQLTNAKKQIAELTDAQNSAVIAASEAETAEESSKILELTESHRKQIAKLESQIAKLKTQLENKPQQQNVDDLKASGSLITQQLKTKDGELKTEGEKITELEGKLQTTSQRVGILRGQLKQLKRENVEHQGNIAKLEGKLTEMRTKWEDRIRLQEKLTSKEEELTDALIDNSQMENTIDKLRKQLQNQKNHKKETYYYKEYVDTAINTLTIAMSANGLIHKDHIKSFNKRILDAITKYEGDIDNENLYNVLDRGNLLHGNVHDIIEQAVGEYAINAKRDQLDRNLELQKTIDEWEKGSMELVKSYENLLDNMNELNSALTENIFMLINQANGNSMSNKDTIEFLSNKLKDNPETPEIFKNGIEFDDDKIFLPDSDTPLDNYQLNKLTQSIISHLLTQAYVKDMGSNTLSVSEATVGAGESPAITGGNELNSELSMALLMAPLLIYYCGVAVIIVMLLMTIYYLTSRIYHDHWLKPKFEFDIYHNGWGT